MLAGIPLTFALGLDAIRHRPRTDGGRCLIVDQQVQRAFPSTVGDGNVQLPLATAQGAEVRDWPVQSDQPKETFDEPCRLPRRHCRQNQWRFQ